MDNTIEYIKIEDIIPNKIELHKQDNTIDGLTISIQNYGIIQPLLLRRKEDKYEIILGNRRYKAALKAGLKQVPAMIAKLNDKEATEYIILDNIQRNELTNDEKKSLYNYLSDKYKTDKYYISSNLGIKNESIEEQKQNTSQSDILDTKEQNTLNQDFTKNIDFNKSNQTKILVNDIVSLDDLNQKELEREDFIMNNEQVNNNNVNTNLNNIPGVNPLEQNIDNGPTFGGRFFPSLEDEQTNMGLNSDISVPTPSAQPSSPLIDLTDLSNEAPQAQANTQITPPTPTPAPTAEVTNPLPQPNINIQNVGEPIPEPNNEIPTPTPNINDPIIPSATTPNLADLSNPTPPIPVSEPKAIDIPQATTPIEIPTPTINTPPTPIEPIQPTIETPVVDSQPITDIPQVETPIPTPTTEINNPLPEVTTTPDIPQLDQVTEMPEPPKIEKNDIEPAINTIKSLVDSMASIGYKLKITENDLGETYNISIDIQK